MERIDYHGSFFSIPPKPGEKKGTPKTKKSFSFADLFEPSAVKTEEKEALSSPQLMGPVLSDEAEIGAALDAVHLLGEKLKQKQTPDLIGEYREAVARFMRLVVDSSFEVKESVYRRARDQAELPGVRIHVINEKVEKLAAQIMKSQKDRLEILRRVDEIYGLLVDLRQ